MSVPDFNAENVEKALHQLYYDPSTAAKDVAQQWLTKAQRSNEAWRFAWELLQKEKATEVQYFGASALLSKISGAWNDIPESEVMVLRNRLYDQISQFCAMNGKQIVLTRLCVVFSAFLAKCAIKNQWPTAVTDVIQKFQEKNENSASDEDRCYALLEILTILSEEYQTSTLEKYNRSLFVHVLLQGQPKVFELLSAVFFNPSMKSVQNRVIKCISSWIQLGIPLTDCEQLLHSVFDCIKEPSLFDASVECMLNTFCSPASQDYPNTIKKFLPLVVSLRPMFHSAVEDQDMESILGLTKLICGLAENFPKLILQSLRDSQTGQGMLCLVMDCASVPLQYPLEEVSSPISFTFWCILQDEIQAMPVAENIAVRHELHPYFYQLVNCLLLKASYPKDNSYSKWSGEEKEQHRIYRVDVSDALMYVIEMLGVGVLMYIFDKLQQQIQESVADSQKPWQGIEVCLYGIHSIVETLQEYDTEITCLKTLVDILPTIHVNSIQLADTIIYTIGTLTEWLSLHTDKFWTLFSIVLSCLSNSELAMAAVLTIRRLTRECGQHLIPHAGNIMEQITTLVSRGILRNSEETWLMQAAGHLLSSISREDCLEYLQNLLMLPLHQLEALSKDAASGPNKNSLLHIVALLSNVFVTLDRRKEENGKIINEGEEQPVVLILHKLNPVFQSIFNVWVSDGAIVQAICNLYENSVRNLVEDFAPILVPLCETLCIVFQNRPYPCILDLSQQFVLVFGKENPHQDTVAVLLQTLSKTVIPIYKTNQIPSHPDIGHSFMRLFCCVCRKSFLLLKHESIKPDLLLDIFQCGIMTLQLPDSESAASSSMFIVEFIRHCNEHKEVSSIFDQYGKDLALVVLKAIGGASPRNSMDHFADILFEMCHVNFQLFNMWMTKLMAMPDVPSSTVEYGKKMNFLKQICRELKNKRKYREFVKEFTLVCRGLDGTEYASSTTVR